MSSMYVMTKVLTVPSLDETVVEEYAQRVVQHMVQQSVGKIGRIREVSFTLPTFFLCNVVAFVFQTACKCIISLLSLNRTRRYIAHPDELSAIYRSEHDFIQVSALIILFLLSCAEVLQQAVGKLVSFRTLCFSQ